MAAGSDIASGLGSGASLGATVGSVIPGVGTAIGAGIGAVAGALAGVGKWLFGRSEAKRAKKQYEDLQRQAEERQTKAIQTGEARAGELYGKYSIDASALQQQYAQALQRGVEQQAGGMTAALSSVRGGMNPALASHLLTGRAAETGAMAAGEGALAQAQLGMQADIYNKQLMQQLRNQEIERAGGLASLQQAYGEQSIAQQQALRQQGIEGAFNLLSTGAGIGMQLSGLGQKKPTSPSQPYSFPSYPMGQETGFRPGVGLGLNPSNFNPYQPFGMYSYGTQ